MLNSLKDAVKEIERRAAETFDKSFFGPFSINHYLSDLSLKDILKFAKQFVLYCSIYNHLYVHII